MQQTKRHLRQAMAVFRTARQILYDFFLPIFDPDGVGVNEIPHRNYRRKNRSRLTPSAKFHNLFCGNFVGKPKT